MTWNEVVATLTEATVAIQTLRAENAELGKQRDDAAKLCNRVVAMVADDRGDEIDPEPFDEFIARVKGVQE